jgi:hypothetical protein
MICAVGAAVGFGVAILQPLHDWRRETIKPFSQYLILALWLCVPWIVGFLAFAGFMRRKRD